MKRIVLMAVLALALPVAAFAGNVDFGNTGGTLADVGQFGHRWHIQQRWQYLPDLGQRYGWPSCGDLHRVLHWHHYLGGLEPHVWN